MSNAVPQGWSELSLKEVSTVITKGTTPTTYGAGYAQSGVKFIRVENISKSGFIDESELRFISKETHETLKRSQLQSGDLLVSIAGAIGRSAIVSDKNLPANTNQAVGIVRLIKEEIIPDFARYSIESPVVAQQMSDSQAGNAQVNLNLEQLGGLRFYRPPLPEQQKIATILSSVDDVIEKTRAQIDKLKDLKTGMMQELLTKGIGHTEFKDSPVGRIPISWSISDMRSLCSVVTKGTTPTSLGHSYKESGINFIKVESIIRNGVIDPNKFSYIDEAANKSLARSVLYAGDILITIAGATVGKLAIVNESHLPANTNQALSIVRVNPSKANRLFLYYWLQSGYIVDQVWSIQTVGAQPNLSLAQVGEFSVPLPSIEEQNQITCQLIALDRKESLISTKLAGLVNLKKALMQDLLTGKVRVKLQKDMLKNVE